MKNSSADLQIAKYNCLEMENYQSFLHIRVKNHTNKINKTE